MAVSPSARADTPVSGPALIPLGTHQGKPPIPLNRPVWVIGSRSSARLRLISPTVSKAHALLVRSNGRCYIRDLASRTRLFINGEQVREADLSDGDLIGIGSFSFQYVAGPGEDRLSLAPSQGPQPIPAKLEVSGSDYPVPIDQRVILIGRRPGCDIQLMEDSVSTAHAVIFEINGQRMIRDLGSRTGTFVNGVSTHQHQLSPGDLIRVGQTEIRYLPNEIVPAIVVEQEPSAAPAEQEQEQAISAPTSEEASAPPPAQEPAEALPLAALPESQAPQESAAVPIAADELPAVDAELPPIPLEPPDRAEAEPEPVEQPSEPAPVEVSTSAPSAEMEMEQPPLKLPDTICIEQELEQTVDVDQTLQPAEAAELDLDLGPVEAPETSQPSAQVPEPALELPEPQPIEELAPSQEQEESPLPLIAAVDLSEAEHPQPPAEKTSKSDESAGVVEVLDRVEPTPESALQAPAQQLALDSQPVSEQSPAEELSDTTFVRQVHELAGDRIGDIVEDEVSPSQQPVVEESPQALPPEPPPAIEFPPPEEVQPLAEPVAEDREPSKPSGQAPATMPWGANQDNFLGGLPLNLIPPPPPIRSPTSRRPSEKAVKDLIDQIDSAAAAARAAAASKPTFNEPSAIAPAPLGEGWRAEQDSSKRAREGRTITTGFDGLALSPLRDADVFSQMSPPQEQDQPSSPPTAEQFQGAEDSPTPQWPPPFSQPRPLRVLPTLPTAVQATVVTEPTALPQAKAERPSLPRKCLRRVGALLATMALLIALACAGVYLLVGVPSTVQVNLTFKNLPALTEMERNNFQVDQLRLLKDESTRILALRALADRWPEVRPGWLDDQVKYFKMATVASFSVQPPYALAIRVTGNQPRQDSARALAMASALYQANARLIDQAQQLRGDLQQLNRAIADHQNRLADLNRQIEQLRLLGQSSPTLGEISRLQSQVIELEKAWNDSVAAVKAAEAELERIRATPPEASTNPANLVDDERLRTMQAQLDELNVRLAATKASSTQRAEAARKALDEALDAFQKQIVQAQQAIGDNPQISEYVQAALKLQETIRQLTEDLIHRQEQQFARLTELSQRLNEKMEQQRAQVWQSDAQLQELTERLAMLSRQYNAAVGSGLQKEADELKIQIELTKNMIKARQELLPGDSFWADAIQQLQLIIESTRKNIQEDRQKTEQLLASLQRSFTSGQLIEKLPEEHRQLAAALQQQLEKINTTRQQYNAAIDAGAEDADSQLKNQIAALQAGIDARRKQLAQEKLASEQQQSQLAAVQAKQAELDRLNQAETAARQAYFARHKELRDAQALYERARASAEELDALIRQKDIVQRSLEAAVAQLDRKQREVDRAVEPIKPTESDVTITPGQDRRLLYTLICCGFILAAFSGLILWTLNSAWKDSSAVSVSLHAADLGSPPDEKASDEAQPPNPPPANPDDKAPQDDQQPATV